LFHLRVLEFVDHRAARIVMEYVQYAEFGLRFGKENTYTVWIADIATQHDCTASRGGHALRRLFRSRAIRVIENREIGSILRNQRSDRPPDARISAR
jgi:hypothetical protein